MARRTVNLPESVEAVARAAAKGGESFSATVSRLIVEGAGATGASTPPSYVGSADGPDDLGRAAERYLGELVPSR
jgi:hypothetical protein